MTRFKITQLNRPLQSFAVVQCGDGERRFRKASIGMRRPAWAQL